MRISKTKSQYSQSLHNLEKISESIHIRRKIRQLWAHKIPPWTHRESSTVTELDYNLDLCDRGSRFDLLPLKIRNKIKTSYFCLQVESHQTLTQKAMKTAQRKVNLKCIQCLEVFP